MNLPEIDKTRPGRMVPGLAEGGGEVEGWGGGAIIAKPKLLGYHL